MRNYGFVAYDKVVELGTNGKMSELAAAMGLTSLDSLEMSIEVNRRNYEQYARELDGVLGVSLLRYDEAERQNYHYAHFSLNEASERMIKRLGFRYVGEQIEEFRKGGDWHNHKTYELLDREFEERRAVESNATARGEP